MGCDLVYTVWLQLSLAPQTMHTCIYTVHILLQDRYAFGQSRPPVDPQQDWTLLRGENMNGYTVLEFWRKWVTCDERDRNVLVYSLS